MSLSDAQFSGLHKQLKTEGGFSVDVKTGKSPTVGYMVAIPGHEEQIRSVNVAPAHLKEYVQKHGADLDRKGAHFGGWDNKAKGDTSLDIAKNIKPDKKVARKYGASVAKADALTSTHDLMLASNQEAAYDVKTGKDVDNPHYKDDGRRNGA
jgi:hypothetical protein